MRDKVIKLFETLVWVLAGIIAIGGVGAGIVTLVQGEVVGLAMIIGGPLYAIVIAGALFIGISINENTRRTAAAVEKLAGR